jgi:hypothetical protein
MKTAKLGIIALGLVTLAGCSDDGPSEAQLRDQQQMARAKEIGESAVAQWKALMTQVAAATEGAPAREQVMPQLEAYKQSYLQAMAELNKELTAMNSPSARGTANTVIERFLETERKQYWDLMNERAAAFVTAHGYEQRDFGDYLRGYLDHKVVHAATAN